jgi:hypothetical protein
VPTFRTWIIEAFSLEDCQPEYSIRSYVQDADLGPSLLPVFHDLFVGVAPLQLIPQTLHLDIWLVFVVADVVQGDHPTFVHKGPVHGEILLDAFVGVVAVDEQEIYASAAENFSGLVQCCWGVGVLADKVDFLILNGAR